MDEPFPVRDKRCKTHSNYRGKRPPVNPCLRCWEIFMGEVSHGIKEPVERCEMEEILRVLDRRLSSMEHSFSELAIDAVADQLGRYSDD